jgi:nucleoside-diphosphate-sugar epimerase
MTRIAVLGANGQVGSEVSLLLSRQPGVEVVPISRTRTGSAFLRSRGLRCRHGRAADPADAARLLSDCDTVLHFARPAGRPGEMKAANEALLANATSCSAPGARIVYFSSLCAYRTFRPVTRPALPTAYGWEKRTVERLARRQGERSGKGIWILRLGHVAGHLQDISLELRRLVREGPVIIPSGGLHASGVVYTATIVDAVLSIASGRAPAGTYDLFCSPPWTWRDVLEHEARVCGVPLHLAAPVPDIRMDQGRPGLAARIGSLARGLVSQALATSQAREAGMILLGSMSAATNLRHQSDHFRRRAGAEIGSLLRRDCSADAFLFAAAGSPSLGGLRPTAQLLADPGFDLTLRGGITPFPADLPPAETPGRSS